MKPNEDKIVSIINENVDYELDYSKVRSKISIETKEKKKLNFKILAPTLISIFVLVVGISIYTGLGNGFSKSDGMNGSYSPSDSFADSKGENMLPEASDSCQESLYMESLVSLDYCEKYYLKQDNLSYEELEVLINYFNISNNVLNDAPTYSIVCGEKNSNNVFAYYDGNKGYSYNVSVDFNEICESLSNISSSKVSSFFISVSENKIKYYTYTNGKLYTIEK